MIKGIKWYSLKLYFGDYARGPESYLESHILGLFKKFNQVTATILKESFHYNMFGFPASSQLFDSCPGTKPIFISEVKIDSFITEIEELALKGKSNILYSKHKISSIIGNLQF